MAKHAGRPELYREYVPENEAGVIERFEAALTQEMVQDFPGNIRPARRRLHMKHHGCVHATFKVMEGVPEDLRHGVFAHPRTYPALIRFSNAFRDIQPDQAKDTRGMAMKLFGVEGKKLLDDESDSPNQDFLFLNNDVIFFRTAADFEHFSNIVTKRGSLLGPLSHFLGWNPFQWKIHEFACLMKATFRKVRNPIAERYWSAVPCRLGPKAMKFTVIPKAEGGFVENDMKDANYLYRAMAEQLRRGCVDFDFLIQLQTDPVKMPIEDSTISWSEKLSPFRKVAEIHVPAQIFDTADLMAFCENLSFTSWRTVPEHMPLGGINRMRRVLYRAISEVRHRMNEVPRREPDLEDLPEAWRNAFASPETAAR